MPLVITIALGVFGGLCMFARWSDWQAAAPLRQYKRARLRAEKEFAATEAAAERARALAEYEAERARSTAEYKARRADEAAKNPAHIVDYLVACSGILAIIVTGAAVIMSR